MKAGGISIRRVMMPMAVVVLMLTGMAFYFANNVMPIAVLKYKMTLYGQISSGFVNDPHLTGDVKVATEIEQKEYNRQTINIQIGNILNDFNNGRTASAAKPK